MSKYLLSEKEYAEYQNMKARLKELKEENKTLKDRLIISNAEHTDYIIKTNEKLAKLRKENEKLKENIKIIFTSLIIANHVDVGDIQDTIWVNDYITLWDYIRNVLNMGDEQFEKFEEQALQKIRKVDNG